MKITKQQIAEIARETKSTCDRNGAGHQIVVWADGAWDEALNANSIIARQPAGGEREAPLIRFRIPHTRCQVAAEIGAAIYYRELVRGGLLGHGKP